MTTLPPQPLPEELWGESWQFVTINAGDLVDEFRERPIPYLVVPEQLTPTHLGLGDGVKIPGVIIYGGKQSRKIAEFIAKLPPKTLDFQWSDLGGLILTSTKGDRWIINTFSDLEVKKSAETFQIKKTLSKGLHFLLVTPDNSGMTDTGFWLLN
jgi:hypothetical protein